MSGAYPFLIHKLHFGLDVDWVAFEILADFEGGRGTFTDCAGYLHGRAAADVARDKHATHIAHEVLVSLDEADLVRLELPTEKLAVGAETYEDENTVGLDFHLG